jgi:MFS family permease
MVQRNKLVLLFSAHIISNFASGITMLAIPWFMVSRLDLGRENAMMMGLITFLTIFWGLYAGTLIDKYNRQRIFQGQQIVAGLIVGGSGLFGIFSGYLPVFVIGLVACATLFSWTMYYPNLYAFVQELFKPKFYKQINSGIELVGQTTNFIGMLAGSVLLAGTGYISWWPESLAIQAWDLEEIFLLDGGTYLISALIISFIRYIPGDYRQKSVGGLFARVRTGYRFLRSRPELLLFGVASYIVFACLLVFVQVAMAMYVRHSMELDFERGAIATAQFEAVYSLGAIVVGLSGVLLARRMEKSNLIAQIIGLLLVMGTIWLTLSLSTSPLIFVIAAFFTGISNSGIRILRVTYLVRIVPNEVIGRTNSFFQVVNVLMRLFFMTLLSTSLFGGVNVGFGLMIMGGACLASGLVLILRFAKFDQEAAYG